jgi:hypothetical protein
VSAGLFRIGHGTIEAIFGFMLSSRIVCAMLLTVFLGQVSRYARLTHRMLKGDDFAFGRRVFEKTAGRETGQGPEQGP